MPDELPVYLTALEVGQLLRLSAKSVYRLVKDDPSMPAIRLGGTVRFPRSMLLRWLEQHAPVSTSDST
jgi:excisionase family DNA binding protein